MLSRIFCRYALVGEDLLLKENVELKINSVGKIDQIQTNIQKPSTTFSYYFDDHVLIPKFINNHTHLGDAILKESAWNRSLADAVSSKGIKYQARSRLKEDRILAMRNALKEMIYSGISTCIDFREGGESGIKELKEAARDLPIDIVILGRPTPDSDLSSIINLVSGIGYSTPLDFPVEDLKKQSDLLLSHGKLISTHVGEDPQVIHKASSASDSSDLQIALEALYPHMLIHLNYTDYSDLDLIPNNIFIVFCPRSNAYFNIKFPPIEYFLQKDHLIGLGTDNIMTTSPNILDELRWVILRLKEQNITFSLDQALKLITTNTSQVLPIESGCIKTGHWADLLVVDLGSFRTKFSKDPISALLFRSTTNDFVLNTFHGKVINDNFS
jgi:cytosine/adenosine deaminase-related metal-dependent hydrolase